MNTFYAVSIEPFRLQTDLSMHAMAYLRAADAGHAVFPIGQHLRYPEVGKKHLQLCGRRGDDSALKQKRQQFLRRPRVDAHFTSHGLGVCGHNRIHVVSHDDFPRTNRNAA